MTRSAMLIAVEDLLSDVVGRAIFKSLGMTVAQTIGLKGNAFLRGKASALNQTAKAFPVFLLTDLDVSTRCPPEVIQDWLGGPPEMGLIFRIAVMEIESWIMADRTALAALLGIDLRRVPQEPDRLPDPKREFVAVARRCRSRALREELVPAPGGTAMVGPGYNARLSQFVREDWSPTRASKASPSLRRALQALQRFRDG